MKKDLIYKNIRDQGGRMTKIRREILYLLLEANCLMSQADILARLNKLKLHPHRSTIFRELLFLYKNNVVIKSTISDTDYYEIPQDYHHHLVCINCNSIKKVEISNYFEKQEKQIAQQNDFNIVNHSLEFYGICHACQT